MQSLTQFHPAIADYLGRYVRRRRWIAMWRALLVALLVAMFWCLAWGVVDRAIAIPATGRWVLLVLLFVIIGVNVCRPAYSLLLRHVNWRQAASDLENHDPRFGQRLVTVVSEALAPVALRGSPQLIDHLTQQVRDKIEQDGKAVCVPMRPVTRALIAACVGAAILGALAFWPWLGLTQLIRRQLAPMAEIAPVHTTRLVVVPGSIDLIQGRPLTITALADQLLGGSVMLRMSTEGRAWTYVGMAPSSDGTYNHTIASVTRDATYQITAGDAASPMYDVRVLRRPLVREFRIRLVYPPYVGKEPLSITNSDGSIQAPVGTKAMVAVVSSEPLNSATCVVDGRRLETQPTGDLRVRQVELTIDADQRWEVEMLSDRQVRGAGPDGMFIRAIPDRPPIARLMFQEDALLLHPRDIAQIPYQAADDYGLTALEARIEIDNSPAVRIPVPVGPDPRRSDDSFILDMTRYNLSIGDIVTVTLAATDRKAQTSLAAPFQILIAPQTISPRERQRVADLRDAARFAAMVVTDLDAARQMFDRSGQVVGKIAPAAKSAGLLVGSLLRCGAGLDDDQLAYTLAALVDAAAVQAARLDQLDAQAGADSPEVLRDAITRAQTASSQLQPLVSLIWQGLWAKVILAQRQNLAVARDPSQPGIVHLREDTDAALREMRLDPRDADVQAGLQARIDASAQFVQSARPVNLVEACDAWVASSRPLSELLAHRLDVAAQVELARDAADLELAGDLQLAARAARSIDSSSGAATRPALDPRQAFSTAFAAIEREDQLRRRPTSQPEEMAAQIRASAVAARQALRALAGEPNPTQPTQSNAGRSGISDRTTVVADANPPLEFDARQQALTLIRRAQEDLAILPQELGRIEQAAQASRRAQDVAFQAARAVDAAPPDERPAAQRAAEVAGMQAAEAFDDVSRVGQAADPERIRDLARDLAAFDPDTAAPLSLIDRQLEPALARLQERIDARDSDGIDRAITEARDATEAVQDALRSSRELLLERDPLVAAKWFAQQSNRMSPSSRPSTQPQNDTLAALRRAWEGSIQRATEARLVGAPAAPPARRRPWLEEDLVIIQREHEPAEYQEALRAYFQVLEQANSTVAP